MDWSKSTNKDFCAKRKRKQEYLKGSNKSFKSSEDLNPNLIPIDNPCLIKETSDMKNRKSDGHEGWESNINRLFDTGIHYTNECNNIDMAFRGFKERSSVPFNERTCKDWYSNSEIVLDPNSNQFPIKESCVSSPSVYKLDNRAHNKIGLSKGSSNQPKLTSDNCSENEISKGTEHLNSLNLVKFSNTENNNVSEDQKYDGSFCEQGFKSSFHRYISEVISRKDPTVGIKTKKSSKFEGSVKVYASDNNSVVPTDSYYCHVCRDIFETEEDYIFHLDKKHVALIKLLRIKNDKYEGYLRSVVELGISNNPELKNGKDKLTQVECKLCQCSVSFDEVKSHKNSFSHMELKEFVQPYCCNLNFYSRLNFEDHRNSKQHLNIRLKMENILIRLVVSSKNEKCAEDQVLKYDKENANVLSHKKAFYSEEEYTDKLLSHLKSDVLIKQDNIYFCLFCELFVPHLQRNFIRQLLLT